MAPNRSSRHSNEQPSDQGELFHVEMSRLAPPHIGEVVEGGVYPDELPDPANKTASFHEAVHEAVVREQQTRHRREGNRGKHSPIARDGNYQQIRLGDYLPGFGPVTERKWEEAKDHARKLEAERIQKLGMQPTLASAMVAEVAEALKMPEGESDEPPFLDTKKKLISLRDDTRAGFLPTTHIEKNQAVEFLDYLPEETDDRLAAQGIHRRLQEIYDHQLKTFRKQGYSSSAQKQLARESVNSVIYTYGDHLQNARESYRHLASLEALLEDTPNPRLSLSEALRDQNADPREGALELVRYMDILNLRTAEHNELRFDPLHPTENREINHEYKNKIVEDPYTTSEQDDAVAQHVATMLQTIKVGHIRQLVKRAKDDQARRGMFWDYILRNTAYTYRDTAEAARSL